MSRTLFRYIFWDLVKIFMMASGVLSAIMSFGGLLKPLYEVGLDVSQVIQILGYFGPAMTAYSLPIAALFATTIVYGRLGADNEITACRAAGISHMSLATPAIILGSLCAFISLALLCFVVPVSMLKVERIIYSNLAQLAVGQIQRTHQVKFDTGTEPLTIFAQSARVLPADPNRPRDQALQIDGGLIVRYEKPERNKPYVPKDFNMTGTAIARLQRDREDSDILLSVTLREGSRFARPTTAPGQDNTQASVTLTELGPFSLPSPVSENTKFMDVFRLWDLQENPEKSRRISQRLRDYVRRDQSRMFLDTIRQKLNESPDGVELGNDSEVYRLHPSKTHPHELRGDRLILIGTAKDPIRLEQIKGSASLPTFTASQMRVIDLYPNTDRKSIRLTVEMLDAQSKVGDEPPANAGNISRPIVVSMPDNIAALSNRPIGDYINGGLSARELGDLKRFVIKQDNGVYGEIHARLSFAVSCFILVMVGCALGMMFRSGNFLSAFALSVIPALLCIALVVSGQHTCENVPLSLPPGWTNPYRFGVALIWSGNVAVLIIASVLLGRLQRQ